MKISEELAKIIVDNIHEVIPEEINFINADGLIIASTDPKRMHRLHTGALSVIRNREQLSVQNDTQYYGARKGINMPVFFDDDIIGVIGITGEEQDVIGYAKILQKMTQILVKDAYYRDIRHQKRSSDRILIERVLSGNFENESLFQNDNLTQRSPRLIVCAKIDGQLKDEQIDRIHRLLEAVPFSTYIEKKALYVQELIFIIPAQNRMYIQQWIGSIREICPHAIFWGIGTVTEKISDLPLSYSRAKTAALWGSGISGHRVSCYEDIGVGMLLPHIDELERAYFLKHLFKDCSAERIAEIMMVLSLYEEHNGSILHCAKACNMHRNSFQYNLMQLPNQNGLDPRSLHDYVLLKLAVVLYQFQQNTPHS